MDCPKCVGKLQPFTLRLYKIEQMTVMPNLGWSWGTSISERLGIARPKTLELDKCFACEGIWFDKDELEKLKQEKVDKNTVGSHLDDYELYKQLNEKGGLCPKCKVPMRKLKGKKGLRHITVDVCGKCSGVWLDGGEVNYILKGGPKEKLTNIWRHFWYNRFIPEKD